jgi:hypothetical protein
MNMRTLQLRTKDQSGLSVVNCGKEYEVRQIKNGLEPIIKEKKVS